MRSQIPIFRAPATRPPLPPDPHNKQHKMLQATKFRQLQRSAAAAPRMSSSPLAVLVNTFATQVRFALPLSAFLYGCALVYGVVYR